VTPRDGGPAWPVADLCAAGLRAIDVNPTTCAPSSSGMSLRDAFALAALQGFMANKARPTHLNPDDDATYIWRVADAMLAAREAKQP
jgi:hypothetical protein